jgi:hypothetical protein
MILIITIIFHFSIIGTDGLTDIGIPKIEKTEQQ